MPLKECLIKVGVQQDLRDYILSKKDLFLGQGLDDNTSDHKAVDEIRNETVDALAKLYKDLNEEIKVAKPAEETKPVESEPAPPAEETKPAVTLGEKLSAAEEKLKNEKAETTADTKQTKKKGGKSAKPDKVVKPAKETKPAKKEPPDGPTIIGKDVDLQGNPKTLTAMQTLDEALVALDAERSPNSNLSEEDRQTEDTDTHREMVRLAIEGGNYKRWIKAGRLTEQDAKLIIESAGMKAPDFQDDAKKSTSVEVPGEAEKIKPIKSGSTVREVLKHIIEQESRFGDLAQQILAYADWRSLKVVLSVRDIRDGRSFYRPSSDEIVIHTPAASNATVLMHEIIHAVTSKKIPIDLAKPNSKTSYGKAYLKQLRDYQANPKGDPAVKELISLYLQAVDKLGFTDVLFKGNSVVREASESGQVKKDGEGKESEISFQTWDKKDAERLFAKLKQLGLKFDGPVDRHVYTAGGRGYGWNVVITGAENIRLLLSAEGMQPRNGSQYIRFKFNYDARSNATTGNADLTHERGAPYGLGNLDEFLAEAFTKESFQKQLASIPSSTPKTSLWERFVHAVRWLINIDSPTVNETLLDDVIRTGATIIAQERDANIKRTGDIFSPADDALSEMIEVVRGLVSEGNSLEEIQAIAAAELGDSQDVRDAVADAYIELGKEAAVTPEEKQITGDVISRVEQWLDNLFGGAGSVEVLKDTTVLMKKANELSAANNDSTILFQILDEVNVFDNPNENEAKAFITRVFATIDNAADARKAYHKLAAKYHPDKNPTPQATAIFQHLNDANENFEPGGRKVDYKGFYGGAFDQKQEEEEFRRAQKEFSDKMNNMYENAQRAKKIFEENVAEIKSTLTFMDRVRIVIIKNFVSGDRRVKELRAAIEAVDKTYANEVAKAREAFERSKSANRGDRTAFAKAKTEFDKSMSEADDKFWRDRGEVFAKSHVYTGSKIFFQRDPAGKVLGFTHNGKVYLNGEHLNPNTPIHEAGHIWVEWAKNLADKTLYNKGIALVDKSRYLEKAKANEFYREQAERLPAAEQEDYYRHEALAMAIGDKGAQFVSQAKKKGFAEWAKALWDSIAIAVGFKDITAKELQNLTFDQFTQRAAVDILKGEKVNLPKFSSIKNKSVEDKRAELNVGGATQKGLRTDADVRAEADQAIANGFDIKELIEDILDNKDQATDLEIELIGRYVAGKEAEIRAIGTSIVAAVQDGDTKGFGSLTKERDVAIQDLNNAYNAARESGTETARALRYRRTLRVEDDSLAGMFVEQSRVSGTSNLTPAQIDNVVKEHEAIKNKVAELEALLAKAEAVEKRKKAESAVKKIQATTTPKSGKKTHQDFVSEREKIIDHLLNKLRKARGEINVTPVPYAKELITIAPDVGRLMKSFVQEGMTKLSDLVTNIHEILKESIDGITEQDVQDIIAGEYNVPKATKNELSEQLYDLHFQARLINKLDALLAGEEPKQENKKIAHNREVEELQNKIKDFRREKRDAEREKNKKPPEQVALASLKTRTANEIKKIQAQLNAGNYALALPSKKLVLDSEAIALRDQLIKLKVDRLTRLAKEEYEKRGLTKKANDLLTEIVNLPRSFMATADLSAPLRQGIVASFAHPILASKAFVEMLNQAVSEKQSNRWLTEIRESPVYTLMQESGLYIADQNNPNLAAKEERFMSNLADRIPIVGIITKASSRAYAAYLNQLRVDLFMQGVSGFATQGMTFENSPDVYKAWASFVNNSTGRGGLGKLEGAAQTLNSFFFSPRLIASRVNLLNPVYYAKLPKPLRMMVLKDMLSFAVVGAAVLTGFALAAGGGDDPEDKFSIELDPRSSDFGKIKVGNTRWDIWGGFQQYIRVIAQLWKGERKTISGKIQDLSGKTFPFKNRGDLLLSFARGKLAPVTGLAVDVFLFDAKNVIGEEVTLKKAIIEHVVPMIWQDTYDAWGDGQGAKAMLTVFVPVMFGVGVSTYKTKDQLKKENRKFNQ